MESLIIWLFHFLFFFFHYQSASSSPLSSSPSTIHSCPLHERSSLLQFKQMFTINTSVSPYYDQCGESGSQKILTWNETTDCCSWDGITCNVSMGHVTGLDLSCSKLYGTIHPNSTLFQLSHLQQLNLAFNHFNFSHISPSFSRFTSLSHLNLSYSFLSGSIPSEIAHLSRLVSLDLSSSYVVRLRLEPHNFKTLLMNLTQLENLMLNQVNISSGLPDSLLNLSSLATIGLRETRLLGDLPYQIFQLPKLQNLNLRYNYNMTRNLLKVKWGCNNSLEKLGLFSILVSGKLLDSIGNLRFLNYLDLRGNQLSGPLPESLGNLTRITSLDLSGNGFTGRSPGQGNNRNGEIPDFFAKLLKLEYLILGFNNFGAGPFPCWVSNLTQLIYLDISNTALTGPIPSNITGFRKLRTLYLSNSSLNGTLLLWLFTIPSLQMLDLSSNQLTGQIHEFQRDSPLVWIDLSYNKLSGPIPQSISSLVNLSGLHLQSNNLSGDVELQKFSNLWVLQLSKNNLSVRIGSNANATWPNLASLGLSSCNITKFPDFLKNSVENFLQVLDLSSNKIHGEIPKWVEGASLYFLDLSHNKLTGEIPSSICNLSSLEVLVLSNNNFTGVIPQCLGNVNNYLLVLDLRMNAFHGAIPTTFANGSKLRSLNLYGNHLQGPVPLSLANCRSLKVLDLGNNSLSGEFPHWLESLPELQVLVLKSNRFHGPIGTSGTTTPFPKLRIINLSRNNFTGLLPDRYFLNFKTMVNVQKSKMLVGDQVYRDSVELVQKGVVVELEHILTVFTAIDFSFNNFKGEIPKSVNGASITFLDLSYNYLQGPLLVPSSVAQYYKMSHNKLTGEIPSSICNLSSLQILVLSNNNFTGVIPQCLGNVSNDLSVLDLRMNGFHGAIPAIFVNGNKLRTLNLNGNHLQGPVPRSLANCKTMEVLDIGNNNLNGAFPHWLEFLPELQVLVLKSNRFHGPIGTLGMETPFPKLRIFDLSRNNSSGLLPPQYFLNFKAMMNANKSKMRLQYMGDNFYQDSVELVLKGVEIELDHILNVFTTIDFSFNNFKGEIPNDIGKLQGLRLLNLSQNSLSGHLPPLLGNITMLESLDLSSNQLTGKIPGELTSLTFLAVLNLSKNHFVGPIPNGKQFDTFENNSYVGNSGLCGLPLSRKCGDSEAQAQPISQDEDNDDFASGFTWRIVLMGYGCGFVIGVTMGFVMFLIGRPRWFTRIVREEPRRKVVRVRQIGWRRGHQS